jgi:hypothetical protein
VVVSHKHPHNGVGHNDPTPFISQVAYVNAPSNQARIPGPTHLARPRERRPTTQTLVSNLRLSLTARSPSVEGAGCARPSVTSQPALGVALD